MKSYDQFINEGFKNLFLRDTKKREELADQVFDILTKSYAKIGGLKSNGFQTPAIMVKKIPFWKLGMRDGKVIAVIMYKDKGGRKSIASGIDRTHPNAKKLFTEMVREDFGRSMGERSSNMLRFVKKTFPELYKKYAIPATKAQKILGIPDDSFRIPKNPPDKFTYEHKFSGAGWLEKVLMGTVGKKIVQPPKEN